MTEKRLFLCVCFDFTALLLYSVYITSREDHVLCDSNGKDPRSAFILFMLCFTTVTVKVAARIALCVIHCPHI